MRIPLEYGDNFPVPTGSWDPAIPWRFPKHQADLRQPSLSAQILPWLMLGLGVTLGVLLMSWHLVPSSGEDRSSAPALSGEKTPFWRPQGEAPSSVSPAAPQVRPIKRKSRVA